MKDICFISALELNKVEYGYELINSFLKFNFDQQADLYFIFNDDLQSDFFDWKNKLILSDLYDKNTKETDVKTEITDCEKKFIALQRLAGNYRFLITLEPESLFIKNINLLKLCYKYFADGMLLGNQTVNNNDINVIKEKSKYFFHKSCSCINALHDSLYLWMNNVCIYDSTTLDDFFKKIDFENSHQNYSFWSFDYYVYMYYLILFRGFVTVDLLYSGYVGFCEETAPLSKEQCSVVRPLLNKIYGCTYANLKNLDNENLFMLFHLDRSPVKFST